MEGWIKLHRKIWDTSFSKRPSVTVVFIYLLTHANHQEATMLWGQEMSIQAGQLVTGRKSIAEQTGLTQQMVRTALVNLKLTNTITIKSYSKFSVITICNWNKYQESTSTSTTNQPATNQQITTNNNDKNEKNEIKRENTVSYLLTLNDEDIKELTATYKVDIMKLKEKAESLHNYCKSHGKIYKNYRALLQNALMRDFGKRGAPFVSKIDQLKKGGLNAIAS